MIDRDAGWLAGMIDGEGSIGLLRTNNTATPSISIYNSHAPTIARCTSLMRSLYIEPKSFSRTRGANKDEHSVFVRNAPEVDTFLTFIRDYLFTKRPQADLVREFARSRIARGNKPLTERELEIGLILNDLNLRGSKLHVTI